MTSDHADDRWDPRRYDRFRAERERPVRDLLDLVRPSPGGRAADLGCGTGRYTGELHHRVGAAETVGIDASARMLAGSAAFARGGVRFVEGDLRDLDSRWDVLFANASIQWLPDHESLLPVLVGHLAPGVPGPLPGPTARGPGRPRRRPPVLPRLPPRPLRRPPPRERGRRPVNPPGGGHDLSREEAGTSGRSPVGRVLPGRGARIIRV